MTNIQILFFCGLTVVFIGVMFLVLWQMHRLKMKMNNLQKEHGEEMTKVKDLCNKIYEKLKEVVDKVNPLLANTVSSPDNEEVVDAEYVPVDDNDDAVIVTGE